MGGGGGLGFRVWEFLGNLRKCPSRALSGARLCRWLAQPPAGLPGAAKYRNLVLWLLEMVRFLR